MFTHFLCEYLKWINLKINLLPFGECLKRLLNFKFLFTLFFINSIYFKLSKNGRQHVEIFLFWTIKNKKQWNH